MNIFDIGIILLLIMFAIVGWKQGAIREIVSLAGIIIVFIIAFTFKGVLGNFLCMLLPFFKFARPLEGMVSLNIFIYQLIAFLVIFALLLGLYSIFLKISKILQKIVNMTIILWLPSKIIGAVVGLIKGYIVLFAVFIVLMIPLYNQELFTSSKMVGTLLYNTPVLSAKTENFTSSIKEVNNLMHEVVNKNITTNEANLSAINLMLKYDIVKKETIERLIKLHKLDKVSNLDSVINNY